VRVTHLRYTMGTLRSQPALQKDFNMEVDSPALGLLIIILLVLGANLIMYAIARGATRGGNSRWMSSLKDSLSKPMNTTTNKSMEELRKKVEELEKKKSDQ